jgi:hypothetical protein
MTAEALSELFCPKIWCNKQKVYLAAQILRFVEVYENVVAFNTTHTWS